MTIMTPQKSLFVIEYLKDLNGTQAAIRAKYAKNSARVQASRLLSDDNIKQAIAQQLECRAGRTLATADFVINSFKEIAERCMQKKAVMIRDGKTWKQATEEVLHDDGTITEEGVWQFDSNGANRALENLGRHLGILVDDKNGGTILNNIIIIRNADKIKNVAGAVRI